jgi:hypothetical protein
MSGSIGGKRIKREEVQPTLDRYINNVLSKMPGFVSAQITGSYNAGTRKDHGDIDLAVHIKGTNVTQVKKAFKAHLDSMDLPEFVSGKNQGKKSQLYGAIVTCGFPIAGREEDYVQVDNIIVTNENEQRFQRKFLDLDAAKQGLVMGVIRTILHHKDANKILEYIGLVDLPKLGSNQEYEFVLSSAGLSFRLVTLNSDMRETNREELWRSANWDLVEYILDPLDLSKSYEELLDDVAKLVKNDNRSKRRIVGIMKSMIKVGPGEVGTPKGDGKIAAIERAETILKEHSEITSLYNYLMENEVIGETDPRKTVGAICKKYDYYDRVQYLTPEQEKFAHIGKNVWFKDASSMIKFLTDNWGKFKGYFGGDKSKMVEVVKIAYDLCPSNRYNTVPFVLRFSGANDSARGIFIRRNLPNKDDVIKRIESILDGLRHNKWEFGSGFGESDASGRLFEKNFRKYLNSIVKREDADITPSELKSSIDKVLGTILQDIIEEVKELIDDEKDEAKVREILRERIQPSGKKASRRTIFSNGFNFDTESLMKLSGKQIADMTLVGKNGQEYYLSLKNGASQSSGPQLSELGKALKFGDTGNKFMESFCKYAIHRDANELCEWYADSTNKEPFEICQSSKHSTLVDLVKLIIGGGYIYVNSNGQIFEVPENYELNDFVFTNITKSSPRGNDMKTLYINGKLGNSDIRLVWRTSSGDAYPTRFLLEYNACVMLYNKILEPLS